MGTKRKSATPKKDPTHSTTSPARWWVGQAKHHPSGTAHCVAVASPPINDDFLRLFCGPRRRWDRRQAKRSLSSLSAVPASPSLPHACHRPIAQIAHAAGVLVCLSSEGNEIQARRPTSRSSSSSSTVRRGFLAPRINQLRLLFRTETRGRSLSRFLSAAHD